MSDTSSFKVALLYPGNRLERDRADPHESRFAALFDALAEAGVPAEPVVWHDDFADEVAAQLNRKRVVIVWCNPIENGRRRDKLDALLRDVTNNGTFVSTHPDTILKLGTKDVLYESRHLPFGSDVIRVNSLTELADTLHSRLVHGARVLKQYRGQSGIGVWKVESIPSSASPSLFRLRHAQRGCTEEIVDMPLLLKRMSPYFEAEAGGHMIDQPWQPHLTEGIVRAYLVGNRVAGFGHQAVNALFPAPADRPGEPPEPGPRLYYGPDDPRFQTLRHRLESSWINLLATCVGLETDQLPLLWDCDFMIGEPTREEPLRYILCEVNVSSVAPFPPSAISPLVNEIQNRLIHQS
jgi:hypothetical protein